MGDIRIFLSFFETPELHEIMIEKCECEVCVKSLRLILVPPFLGKRIHMSPRSRFEIYSGTGARMICVSFRLVTRCVVFGWGTDEAFSS